MLDDNHNILCTITDGAPNMVKAADLLKSTHFICFAHFINTALKNSTKFDDISNNIINKAIETFEIFFSVSKKIKWWIKIKNKCDLY